MWLGEKSAFLVCFVFCATAYIALKSQVARSASTASTTANATATVIASIGITKVSDLVFGSGAPGDAALVVPAGTAENASNASFNVTGQANTAYTITLPTSVTMITGTGGTNRTIVVNTFTSTPAAGANGLLSAGGAQTLFVGATRAALGASQIAGAYTAAFTVTVAY